MRVYLEMQKGFQIVTSPRFTPAWVTRRKAGNLEHPAQPAGRSMLKSPFQVTQLVHWPKPFPDTGAGFCFFQESGLV